MAATAKSNTPSEIVQGPGDVWAIPLAAAPSDANVRLTLASDGTPDATAHPGSVHLGAIASAITTNVKPETTPIQLDQYDAPLGLYVAGLSATIEAELAQVTAAKVQRMLGVATYSAGAGYKQCTFGGTNVVPTTCLAVISPSRTAAAQHVVAILYVAVGTGGFQLSMGRAKAATTKTKFLGMADPARTAGKQVGVIYRTLADAAGGTPTAKDFAVAEIYQGPADLWIIDAPTDTDQRVTLAADGTPDSSKHPNAVHLGMTAGPVDFSVMPKIELIKADQFDAGVAAWVGGIEAKIETELLQSSMDKLQQALSVGTYTLSAGAYAQTTFGGLNQPATVCVAAIGKQRTDATKSVVCCLYAVSSKEGITWTAARSKTSTNKVTFEGISDITRTAGRQMGIFHEQV